jgi:hypothetical protein
VQRRSSPLTATPILALAAISPLCLALTCGPPEIIAGVLGATAVGSYTPAHEIEQIYYIGSFDPREQFPPEFYRITVRGQASFISNMRFGSGWVPSEFIDSLGTSVEFDMEKGKLDVQTSEELTTSDITEGRGLIQFGPEGMRAAPRDHRLVIVMGSSPEKFFRAIDQSLGVVARAQKLQTESNVSRNLFAEYVRLSREHEQLVTLGEHLRESIQPAEPTP